MRKKRTDEQKKSHKKKQDKEFVIIGSKEELCTQKRLIDYGDMQEKYNSLRPIYQQLIDDLVLTLTSNIEYVGYNLKQIQDWYAQYRNPNPQKIVKKKRDEKLRGENAEEDYSRFKRYMIAQELASTKIHNIYGDEKGEEILSALYNEDITIDDLTKRIEKRISDFQSTVTPLRGFYPKKNTEEKLTGKSPAIYIDTEKEQTVIDRIIDLLCQYYLISPELIYNGRGEIPGLRDPYFDMFLEDLKDDKKFAALAKKITEDEFSTLSILNSFITNTGLNYDEVYEPSYVVIKYSGSYQILNTDEKYIPSKKLIDNWIETLYDDQMRHQEIYDKMLEKGTFNTLVALRELEKGHRPT